MIKTSITVWATVASAMMLNILPSQALPVAYDFTVVVKEGSLAGKTFEGSFSYDDEVITGKGTEEITVADGLKTNINFFGENYTEKEDQNYPQFPKLIFQDGEIYLLDFWVEPGERDIWWRRQGWEIELSPREDR